MNLIRDLIVNSTNVNATKITNVTNNIISAPHGTNITTTEAAFGDEEHHKAMVWWEFVLIVAFVILCGVFSGNNIGIMAYDIGYLEMLSKGPYETKEDE